MTQAPPPSYACPFCGMVSYHPKDLEHRFCARCDKFENEPRSTPPSELDVPLNSPAIQRLLDEIRNGDTEVGRVFNRTYNRHNR